MIRPIESHPAVAAVKKRSHKTRKARSEPVQSAFSHPGMFDLLSFDGENGSESSESVHEGVEDAAGGVPLPKQMAGLALEDKGEQIPEGEALSVMPPWESDFWNVYGNKLRVNGTQEGICYLVRPDPPV